MQKEARRLRSKRGQVENQERMTEITRFIEINGSFADKNWTDPTTVDKFCPHDKACSKASGLTPEEIAHLKHQVVAWDEKLATRRHQINHRQQFRLVRDNVAREIRGAKQRYGAPRLTDELCAQGLVYFIKTVANCLRRQGLGRKPRAR